MFNNYLFINNYYQFYEMIRIIRCYVSPLLCPLPQEDATTPPSHKQILGCMHLPRAPQRLMQIAVKYE